MRDEERLGPSGPIGLGAVGQLPASLLNGEPFASRNPELVIRVDTAPFGRAPTGAMSAPRTSSMVWSTHSELVLPGGPSSRFRVVPSGR